MNEIILSIHPEHAENIIAGRKTIELRKTVPKELKQKDGTRFRVYMYVTGGVGIIGHFEMDTMLPIMCGFFPEVARKLAKNACVSWEHCLTYNPKYGWVVCNPVRYMKPLTLAHFGLKRPPQSWQYVK